MDTKNKCEHTLGYTERERYDCTETNFISGDFYDMNEAKDLKSGNGTLYNFCPYCGESLTGVLDSRINFLTDEKLKREKEEAKAKEKANKIFMKEVKDWSEKKGLDRLPEEGYFLIITSPMSKNDSRDYLLRGNKEEILRSFVSNTKYHPEMRDGVVIKKIMLKPSMESFKKFMADQGFSEKNESSMQIQLENIHRTFDLSSSGVVYINDKITDPDDGQTRIDYDQVMIYKLGEYFKKEYPMEEIKLI